ncbi:dihydroorotase, mitochondrial isoform X1 [Tanacetum coccineum]
MIGLSAIYSDWSFQSNSIKVKLAKEVHALGAKIKKNILMCDIAKSGGQMKYVQANNNALKAAEAVVPRLMKHLSLQLRKHLQSETGIVVLRNGGIDEQAVNIAPIAGTHQMKQTSATGFGPSTKMLRNTKRNYHTVFANSLLETYPLNVLQRRYVSELKNSLLARMTVYWMLLQMFRRMTCTQRFLAHVSSFHAEAEGIDYLHKGLEIQDHLHVEWFMLLRSKSTAKKVFLLCFWLWVFWNKKPLGDSKGADDVAKIMSGGYRRRFVGGRGPGITRNDNMRAQGNYGGSAQVVGDNLLLMFKRKSLRIRWETDQLRLIYGQWLMETMKAAKAKIEADICRLSNQSENMAWLIMKQWPSEAHKPIVFVIGAGQAIVAAVTSGNKIFFLGTDSTPHDRLKKECACECVSVFNALYAVSVYDKANIISNGNVGKLI